MKMINRLILTILGVTALLTISALSFSATSNPSPASPGYLPMVIPIQGSYTSSTTAAVKWKMPVGYKVLAASATARASSGTNPTLTVDLKTGSTSLFSTPVSVTAGSIAEATLGTTTILADEANASIDLAIGGTNTPTFTDITVFLWLKRR
jgi:hypothetical protein